MTATQETHLNRVSPFLSVGSHSTVDSLAVLHLKRDLQIPVVLRSQDDLNEGYSEGKVTNTRFGSFPHSTLINVPWGSQVRASAVDTGSRGRKGLEAKANRGQKRKRDIETPEESTLTTDEPAEVVEPKSAVAAPTGFIHLLPPTPESWTLSLPHRTQVVYTPDYSYILQRLRVRPGTVIIEAGAGSGSFTHAAARAVFNGYPDETQLSKDPPSSRRRGKVWSFEFHEQRVKKLEEEIKDHGLDGVVELIHRDVCADRFSPNTTAEKSIQADAIFLDLPAPWLALDHLSRRPTSNEESINKTKSSPLNSKSTVRLCTFSPCIEQVQRTVSTMRQQGWLEIEMVEIAARRIEVRRERVGLHEEGLRGVNASPASVEESLTRLREMEGRTRAFHEGTPVETAENGRESPSGTILHVSKQQRLKNIREAQVDRKLYKEGNLIHRTEPELKTHTSYLVFAILPQEWSDEDEQKAQALWSSKPNVPISNGANMSRRQMKKVAKAEAGGNKASETARTTRKEEVEDG